MFDLRLISALPQITTAKADIDLVARARSMSVILSAFGGEAEMPEAEPQVC